MKRKIRLTESQLHRVIKEATRKVLREAGNLYFKDEGGHIHTNAKRTWRGVPGTVFISHGEWSDPEIYYKGKELNAEDVEEYIWVRMRNNVKKTEQSQMFLISMIGATNKVLTTFSHNWMTSSMAWMKISADTEE